MFTVLTMFMALASGSSEIAPVMGVTIGVAAVAGFAISGGFSGSLSTESDGSGSREGPARNPQLSLEQCHLYQS